MNERRIGPNEIARNEVRFMILDPLTRETRIRRSDPPELDAQQMRGIVKPTAFGAGIEELVDLVEILVFKDSLGRDVCI